MPSGNPKINFEARPSPDDDEDLFLRFKNLSPAELKVVELAASGMESKEVAEALGINYKTVESHRTNTLDKLGLKGGNLADLTRVWMKFGDKTDPLQEEETLP